MATGAVLRCLQDVYTQPSFYASMQRSLVGDNSTALNASCRNESEMADGQAEHLLTRYVTLPLTNAAHFGLATGLLMALVFHARLPLKKSKSDPRAITLAKHAETLFLRLLFSSTSLVLTSLFLPLLSIVLVLLAAYRHFVHLLLSAALPSYAGLLDGTDAVWALEDDASKSVINVLAMFDVEIVDGNFEPRLLNALRNVVRTRILATPRACPKFWQHRRRSWLGYFYWERQQEVHVEEHIQYMTQEDDQDNQSELPTDEEYFRNDFYGMSESVLKALVSELANSPLPGDNAATWEVLVGRDPIMEDLATLEGRDNVLEDTATLDPFEAMEAGISELKTRYRRYPVLFRVHHSMGDGVALIRLLLEALADKTTPPEVVVDGDHPPGVVASRLLRRTSTIESVSLIPCSTGSSSCADDSAPYATPGIPPASGSKPVHLASTYLNPPTAGHNTSSNSDCDDSLYLTPTNTLTPYGTPVDLGSIFLSPCLTGNNDCLDPTPQNIPTPYGTPVDPEAISLAAQCSKNDPNQSCKDDGDTLMRPSDDKAVPHPTPPVSHLLDTPVVPIKIALRTPSTEIAEILADTTSDQSDDDDDDDDDDVFKIVDTDWPVTDSFVTIADEATSCRDTAAGNKSKTIYFYKETAVINDDYEKLRCYSTPLFIKSRTSLFNNDDASPRVRRTSVVESLRHEGVARSGSALARLLHEQRLPPRCESLLHGGPATRDDGDDAPPRCESPIPPYYRPETPFARDNSAESLSPDLCPADGTSTASTARDTSILPHYYVPKYVVRSESPAPKIHRKKYDNLWNDKPSSTGVDATFSKLASRANTPVPRNDNPIPRCNSPFQRSNTPLFVNPNPTPRCVSPLPACRSNYHGRRASVPLNYKPFSATGFQIIDNSDELSSCNDVRQRLPVTQEGCMNSGSHAVSHDKAGIHKDITKQSKFEDGINNAKNQCTQSENRYARLISYITHRFSLLDHVLHFGNHLVILLTAPATLINQTLMRAVDVNPLHPAATPLSGRKIVAWHFDPLDRDDPDGLLNTVKRVKRRRSSSDVKFNDVFLAALSSSLESYFLGVGRDDAVPATVTVALPARMGYEDDDAGEGRSAGGMPAMVNRFSVALLSLPITPAGGEQSSSYTPIGRLAEVHRNAERLRASADYRLNYWLMAVVSKYLPVPLLAPVLNNVHSTLVVSNVVGPPARIRLGGYQLQDMAFWVPTRAATGVGVSVISYAGRLQLGIVADDTLVTCHQDADAILDGVVAGIHCLDDATAL